MSTKIYNGYRLPKNKSIITEWDMLEKLSTALYKKCVEEITNMAYIHLVTNFKSIIDDKQELSKLINKIVIGFHDNFYRNKRSYLSPNMEFSVVFLRNNLCMLFHDCNDYADIFMNITGAEFYPYWDNTDPLEGVSNSEWEHRGELWDDAIKEDGVPSSHGLIFEPNIIISVIRNKNKIVEDIKNRLKERNEQLLKENE